MLNGIGIVVVNILGCIVSMRPWSELMEDVRVKSGYSGLAPAFLYATHPNTCPFKFRMRHPSGKYFYVPCGKCLYCQEHAASGWKARQLAEASASSQTFFTTLTYDDVHKEPISKYTLQCFFKRLRKVGLSFRYIALAEYGPRTHRPHYHVLFFLHSYKEFSCPTHFENYLLRFWRNGNIQAKVPTVKHHEYISGYSKGLFVETPSWKLYSRRPGIGKDTDYYLAMMEFWSTTGERKFQTADGELFIPYSCILDWRKQYDITPDPPDFSRPQPTYNDYARYAYDLKMAYDRFIARKL